METITKLKQKVRTEIKNQERKLLVYSDIERIFELSTIYFDLEQGSLFTFVNSRKIARARGMVIKYIYDNYNLPLQEIAFIIRGNRDHYLIRNNLMMANRDIIAEINGAHTKWVELNEILKPSLK